METAEFDFILPPELIAQEPPPERGGGRLMVLDRKAESIEHRFIRDLPAYLKSGDLLVVNDTRVIPARLFCRREDTGGRVELLLIEPDADVPGGQTWWAMFRASAHARTGMRMVRADGRFLGEIGEVGSEGRVRVAFAADTPVAKILEEEGLAPVPPYIRRPAELSAMTKMDRDRYQTVYARESGAIAAPTAGLHFTGDMFERLDRAGVRRTAITLHVGPGTFKPVKSDVLENHRMESERYGISEETASAIRDTKKETRRVVAVGSTVVRTLETVASERGEVTACSGRSSLFIYPPYKFQVVDVMLTNFHLPKSTLIMMVSALAGKDFIMRAYKEAVRERYRFYSYGDGMLIL